MPRDAPASATETSDETQDAVTAVERPAAPLATEREKEMMKKYPGAKSAAARLLQGGVRRSVLSFVFAQMIRLMFATGPQVL